MCVGICGWRHQCSSYSEITKREGYSWARCQRVSVVSSRSQCGCQAQNMSNILIVFTSIKVLHGSVTRRCDSVRHDIGRPLHPLTFYPAVILDQAVPSLSDHERQHLNKPAQWTQTHMCCHPAAFLHLRWESGPRLCFRLAEVQVQKICVTKSLCVCSLHAPMCSSIIFWLSDFLYLPATGFSLPSI